MPSSSFPHQGANDPHVHSSSFLVGDWCQKTITYPVSIFSYSLLEDLGAWVNAIKSELLLWTCGDLLIHHKAAEAARAALGLLDDPRDGQLQQVARGQARAKDNS